MYLISKVFQLYCKRNVRDISSLYFFDINLIKSESFIIKIVRIDSYIYIVQNDLNKEKTKFINNMFSLLKNKYFKSEVSFVYVSTKCSWWNILVIAYFNLPRKRIVPNYSGYFYRINGKPSNKRNVII